MQGMRPHLESAHVVVGRALEDLQQQRQQQQQQQQSTQSFTGSMQRVPSIARLTLVKEPMLIPRESGRSHLSGTAHTVRTSQQAQRSKAALRRVNEKEGETRGCSGQRKAKLKPVVVEPVASEQQRNQADLSNGVTTATAAAASGAHLHGWCPSPAG